MKPLAIIILLFALVAGFALLYLFFANKVETSLDIGPVIGGILDGDEMPDLNLFSSTISSLVQGDKKQYSKNIVELRSTLEAKDISDIAVKGKRSQDTPYKGIYLNDVRDMRWALASIGKIKSAGVDTLLFEIHYGVDEDNLRELYIPGEEVYLFYLSAFQKSGFRIWLTLGYTGYDFPYAYFSKNDRTGIPPLENQNEILGMFEPHILRWAEIAEKYNIDTFIPSEEANTALLKQGVEKTSLRSPERELMNNWIQEILPKIQEKFSGKIGFASNDAGPCERLGTSDTRLGPDFNYRGYDFILYKFPFRSVFGTDEQWDELAGFAISHTLTFVERDGVSGLVLYETGDTVGEALEENFAGNLPIRNTDEQHQKESYEKYFELIENNNQIVGMFFKLSDKQPHEPSWNPFGRQAEEILKDNFAKDETLALTKIDKLWIVIGEEGLKAIQICLSEEIPFDPEYYLNEQEYKEFISKVKPLCRSNNSNN